MLPRLIVVYHRLQASVPSTTPRSAVPLETYRTFLGFRRYFKTQLSLITIVLQLVSRPRSRKYRYTPLGEKKNPVSRNSAGLIPLRRSR